ncbi:conserved hypothetical protein [Echinococcus multilocularis]|uniref:Uncharacterized protein n=1 Tax=Echinococcus multilocularis TaxID=6211 RepID=A0A087W1K3_ECHMU|nr:conserved hypothetical protein [Echinococcus multilocularis]
MQDLFRSRSLPTQPFQRSQQLGPTPVVESEEDRVHQLEIDLSQNKEKDSKMEPLDELFCRTNKFIDALMMGKESRNILRRFQEMTECQKLKIQYARSFLQLSQELEELRETVLANSPQPFSSQQNEDEPNKWDCIDRSTRFYNTLSADQMKFCSWISSIDKRIPACYNAKDPVDSEQSPCAEVLCDFESDQGLVSHQEVVRIVEIKGGNALVIGRAYTTERQVGQKFGLYSTLKSSIERQHHSSDTSSQTCDSCRVKGQTRWEQDNPKISRQIRFWIPQIYLQPISLKTKLTEKALDTRQFVLSIWESYVKETAQAVMNLLYITLRRWSKEKMDVDYVAINGDMKQSLKSFFRSLEGSLSNDWECEIHYELILQQLRLLQAGANATNDGPRSGAEEMPNEDITERIGQLMLERRIIFRLLEQHQGMQQAFEASKAGPMKPNLGFPLQLEGSCGSELKDTETYRKLDGYEKRASLNAETGRSEMHLNCTMSETSLLSPPPPFDKPPEPLRQKTGSLSKKPGIVERIEKHYGSEPCILEAAACRRHQAHTLTRSGRYRSADLSLKGLDKCSRLRARSFGQGSKSLPRTSYPLPVMKKSSPVKLAAVHPVGGMDSGSEVGYVVIMRPSFRERITTVLDTRRRKRVSIHAAIERGIAGFESGATGVAEAEEGLSEKEQKECFFVYDTASGTKLNFSQALRDGIIHYDSSATESIVFDEYAKSEWRGVKSVYHPLVYRVEQVREVVERGEKLIRQKHKWMPFHQAIETGRLDRRTAEYVVRTAGDADKWGEEVLRLPFTKALAYGLVKVVALRHCLIEKLPRDKCIFA